MQNSINECYAFYCECCKRRVFQAEKPRLLKQTNGDCWTWVADLMRRFTSWLGGYNHRDHICERCFLKQIMEPLDSN